MPNNSSIAPRVVRKAPRAAGRHLAEAPPPAAPNEAEPKPIAAKPRRERRSRRPETAGDET